MGIQYTVLFVKLDFLLVVSTTTLSEDDRYCQGECNRLTRVGVCITEVGFGSVVVVVVVVERTQERQSSITILEFSDTSYRRPHYCIFSRVECSKKELNAL